MGKQRRNRARIWCKSKLLQLLASLCTKSEPPRGRPSPLLASWVGGLGDGGVGGGREMLAQLRDAPREPERAHRR